MEDRFDRLGLAPELLLVLGELGIIRPTPIQALSLPLLLAGKDVIGRSKTGSGKTLAFSLPLLQKVKLEKGPPQALVLCPTRELSAQVAREIRRLGRRRPSLKVLELAGGSPFGPQARSLGAGAHIVVGTPGRVLDHFRRRTIDVRSVRQLVLDEADRMLDMGFQEEMDEILSALPSSRQTILFSATYPESIHELSRDHQKNPESVTVEEEKHPVRQLFFQATKAQKTETLRSLLRKENPRSALIFCNFKASVEALAGALEEFGLSSLHGDMEQVDRNRVMAMFRNGSLRAIVATDVAARGIDVADLDLVVNYELPSPEVYTHRIGRSGRAGKSGLAFSLVSEEERKKLSLIEAAGVQVEWGEIPEEPKGPVRSSLMATLYIGGGRKDKLRPGDILGALTGEAGGLNAEHVGKIEIHDRFSYVAVSASEAEAALERLRKGKIKGRKFRVEPVQ